jgi:CBS domain-containing protein
MKVEQLMTRTVVACHPTDTLEAAARIMWEHDCGCVPVVVGEDGGGRVVGMLTDRDVCMAAYTQGRPLRDLMVSNAMARDVRVCGTSEPIGVALKIMRTNQLHRLPVVDARDHLVGLLSLADVAREAAREAMQKKKAVAAGDIGETVEAISQPRSPRQVAVVAA